MATYFCYTSSLENMTLQEREQLEKDYALYVFLLDYYAKNRASAASMTDQEYLEHIDAILDELNRIKKLLGKTDTSQDKP